MMEERPPASVIVPPVAEIGVKVAHPPTPWSVGLRVMEWVIARVRL